MDVILKRKLCMWVCVLIFGSPVTSICVDPGGRLLCSGHEDASIMLYDIGGSKVIQIYR